MKLYENDVDRKNEQKFADHLWKEYDCVATKLDMKYGVDFFVVGSDGRAMYWIEFKNRSLVFDTYMISVYKIWRGRSLAQRTGMQFKIVVEFELKYYTVEVTEDLLLESAIAIGGRRDRGTAGSVEPMYFIPWDMFREI